MLLCESTFLDAEKELAREYKHMTAREAACFALEAGVDTLILRHFSARYRDVEAFVAEAKTIFPQTYGAEDLKTFPFPKGNGL